MFYFFSAYPMISAILCALISIYLGIKFSKVSASLGKMFYILAALAIGGFIAKMFFAALMWLMGWLVALVVIIFIVYELFKNKASKD